MKNIYYNLRLRLQEIASDNRGVAAVEVILILVDIFIFNYICVSSI